MTVGGARKHIISSFRFDITSVLYESSDHGCSFRLKINDVFTLIESHGRLIHITQLDRCSDLLLNTLVPNFTKSCGDTQIQNFANTHASVVSDYSEDFNCVLMVIPILRLQIGSRTSVNNIIDGLFRSLPIVYLNRNIIWVALRGLFNMCRSSRILRWLLAFSAPSQ